MIEISETSLSKLEATLYELYARKRDDLPFHGWVHVNFVRTLSRMFAKEVFADVLLTETAALLHDLNYIIDTGSEPALASEYRLYLLLDSGYNQEHTSSIEEIILESHLPNRGSHVSNEGKALSDADTLYKALPVTPILYSRDFIVENEISVFALAEKIVSEQEPLIQDGIYFYTDLAKSKYMKWAVDNLNLWKNVLSMKNDSNLVSLLSLDDSGEEPQ